MDLDFRDGLLVFQIAKLDPSEHSAAREEMRTAGMGANDIARVFKQARALCELIDYRIAAARSRGGVVVCVHCGRPRGQHRHPDSRCFTYVTGMRGEAETSFTPPKEV